MSGASALTRTTPANPPAAVDSRGSAAYSARASTVLQPFRAALAGRSNAPVNIVVLGDSTEEGTGAGSTSAARNLSWPDKLAQLLRYRFPTPGETQGPVPPNYVPVYTASTVPTGWTVNTGWALQLQYGPSATSAKCNTTGSTISYVIPVGCTSLDLHYVAGTSLTGITYNIDGAAESATLGTTGSNRETTLRLTGWTTNATHTLTITGKGNNSFVDGVMLYAGNESVGIRVFNGGHHGSRAPQYLNGAVGGFNGWINNASPSPSGLSGVQSMVNLNPDLLMVGLGYNDINNSITSATFATSLQTIVAACRAMLPSKTIPVIYFDKWTPGPTWISGGVEPWQNYVAARKAVAAADPWGLYVSLAATTPVPGSTVATQGSIYLDSGVHGVAKGYSLAADQFASLLAA